MIELRGVSKAYLDGARRRVVFDALEARIGAGEVTAIVGRSGSGKSTLLNLLSGIDLPDAGEVRLDGVALNRLSERERTLYRRRAIGFVFQFFNLIPTLTVGENLLLPLELLGRGGAAGERHARGLLDRVDLADRYASFPDTLSGGEQQRVAVVRALVHAPPLVLADEPTGNLDGKSGEGVLSLLAGLSRDAGTTLVMVTHSREAAAHADRVLGIEDGRLIESGGALP